jgi:hypothetical protein
VTETRVKPLLELPDSIYGIRSEFVEKLTEAVTRPERTAANYVVTPPLVGAFEKALRIVGVSLQEVRSRAAFLHGSFGSGKSHFMALLSLLLDGNEAAWRIPELHALRARNAFIGNKRLLQLHFHVTGAASLEAAIFSRYVAFVREQHPTAVVPGVFADEQLFADARRLLDELGDDAFFGRMNDGAPADDAWGDFAGEGRWDRARFDACAASTDTDERQKLFSALVKTRFAAYAQESRQFVDFDAGLAVIGRHAKTLGYDGIVLFLDELILWLATRASDVGWFHSEVQKMVKLVEAQDARREIPFISFIARQRDLSEMVGETYAGFENRLVRDSLRWNEGRYETVTLEDRNLPAIVEKRVLKAKDAEAKKTLDAAFDKLQRTAADPAWRTMAGGLDAADFRRLYPFSPALVDALVALSNALQRERTAIKLLNEILVEHIDDLKLGDVVGVGDLWDVLAGGEDTADGVMKARFESAKQLYNYRFLPMLQEQHGTNTAEKCQRLRADHPARLGCSNCPVTACRNDNRVLKTLIISALVPEVPALKGLTASRLVQLNHGSIRLPIPGTEAGLVAKKLRDWAANLTTSGQLDIGKQADPSVSLQLEGVDLAPILQQHRHVDTAGARQRVLRDLLFDALQVEKVQDWGKDHKHKDWRGTDRLGHIRFGNVRKMGPDALRCPDDHDWRLVVDYPFDDAGHGPHEDEAAVEQFRDTQGGSWTLVWLPSFFSPAMNQRLGDLVILEHILENPRAAVAHLSADNQQRAVNDLHNLKNQLKDRVARALEQAYGLAAARDDDIDGAQSIERHLQVLKPGAQVQIGLVANLATALDNLVPALLEARYPRHPRFTMKLTGARVERLVEKFGEIVDSDDKRIAADRALVEEMRGTLEQLGLVRVTETSVHLVEDRTLVELERRRQQQANDRPEVGELRGFIDETGKMGLQAEAYDVVVRCYARWSLRTFMSGGQPFDVRNVKAIPAHVVLEKPDLPTHDAWSRALQMAGTTLGVVPPGKALHADHVKRFEADVLARAKAKQATAARLPTLLRQRQSELGLVDGDRTTTAASADALLSALAPTTSGRSTRALIDALAGFTAATSARAVGQSIGAVEECVKTLEDDLVFGPFAQAQAKVGSLAGAREILDDVAQCLRQDELNQPLATTLRALAKKAQGILNPPPPPGRVLVQSSLQKQGKAEVLAELQRLLRDVEGALAAEGDADVVLTGSVTVTAKGRR